jgi:hypothetical protein
MITNKLDPRVLRMTIEIDGIVTTYEGLSISVKMEKWITTAPLVAYIEITNLKDSVASSIITEGTPFNQNRTPKTITIEAGREDGGSSKIFVGNIFRAQSSQPPDRVLTIESRAYFFEGAKTATEMTPGINKLSAICKSAANDLGLSLDFRATDKNIRSYSFSGGAQQQLKYVESLAEIDVFSDLGVLYVKDKDGYINDSSRTLTNKDFVGMPLVSERGVVVKYLFDNQTNIGDRITIESDSEFSIEANGSYIAYRIEYDLATRENQFYVTVHGSRALQGGAH